MAHTGINVICIVLLMIHMFAAEDASCHKTDQACRVVAWREWESCRGLCKHPTQQVRKRTICIDDKLLSQRNFSREDVIKYCNITQPTLEYRPCPICPTGVYSEESQKCELCDYANCSDNPCKNGTCLDTMYGMRCSCHPGYTDFDCGKIIPRQKPQHEEYEFPSWFPYIEYGILTLTSLIIIMTAGCVCRKCCHICGCSSFDDDDDDNDEQRSKRKKEVENSHQLRQYVPGIHRSSIVDF